MISIRLLFIIAVTQMATAQVILTAPSVFQSVVYTTIILSVYYLSALVGAPFQGHVSDKYHRKATLISANVVVALSQFCLLVVNSWPGFSLVFAVLGLWGNSDVIARAALFDDSSENMESLINRLRMGLSFAVLAIAWLAVPVLRALENGPLIASLVNGVLAIIAAIVAITLKSSADKDPHEALRPVRQVGLSSHLFFYLIVLLSIQIAYQIVFVNQEIANRNFFQIRMENNIIAGAGFMIGCVAQSFVPYKNTSTIRIGLACAFCVLFLTSLLLYLPGDYSWIIRTSSYGIFNVCAGFYLPRYFLHQIGRFKRHEHGFVLGMLESALVLGELVAAGVLMALSPQYVPVLASALLLIGYLMLSKINSVRT